MELFLRGDSDAFLLKLILSYLKLTERGRVALIALSDVPTPYSVCPKGR
jgi:hypothetical protein